MNTQQHVYDTDVPGYPVLVLQVVFTATCLFTFIFCLFFLMKINHQMQIMKPAQWGQVSSCGMLHVIICMVHVHVDIHIHIHCMCISEVCVHLYLYMCIHHVACSFYMYMCIHPVHVNSLCNSMYSVHVHSSCKIVCIHPAVRSPCIV